MSIAIAKAIRSLDPNSLFSIRNGVINWETDPIDQASIDAEVARLQAEQDATQYQRDRKGEYPSVDELIVALWEGVVEERMASVTALEAVRQAVKAKYPKP